MIHFDLDDRYQDENVVGSALTRRDGIMLSLAAHVLLGALLMYGPDMAIFELNADEFDEIALEVEQDEPQRFVFVQPLLDVPAPAPPPVADLSDQDRQAQAPETSPLPANELPFALGNTPEQIEQDAGVDERLRGPDVEPAPPQPESQVARATPPEETGLFRPPPVDTAPPPRVPGDLGESLRNLERFIENQTFDNPQGGNDRPGATIQFDTKGVEFGPWLRRFIAQVRSNWFIPQAAFIMSGRVVLQFNIHKDGRITDVNVAGPSGVEAFNRAAYGAIVASNPTEPLPAEYPDERAFFTVTFYYNDRPGR